MVVLFENHGMRSTPTIAFDRTFVVYFVIRVMCDVVMSVQNS